MARITAEQVAKLLGTRVTLFTRRFASALNDRAIRRLVVEACVEELMPDPEIEECVTLTAFGIPVFVPCEELLAALCPATPKEEEAK